MCQNLLEIYHNSLYNQPKTQVMKALFSSLFCVLSLFGKEKVEIVSNNPMNLSPYLLHNELFKLLWRAYLAQRRSQIKLT